MLYNLPHTCFPCNAIATASSTFATEGWTILWVTRATLKGDIVKNQFDQVCNLEIRKKIRNEIIIPNDSRKRSHLLSKSWKIQPLSYRQFTNLIHNDNQYHDKLVNINGKEDPFKKTLLIIDEAHKLYGESDLTTNEKPDMHSFKESIQKSYDISGDESIKLLLMTGTPITKDPMELIKLINLLKPSNEQMPDTYDNFKSTYLDKSGLFTENKYLNDITGYISYLNREGDARQFAQPTLTFINCEMSRGISSFLLNSINDLYKKLDDINHHDNSNRKIISDIKSEIRNKKKQLKNDFSQEGVLMNKCT
ncbi:MAG: hypothetical protein EOO18_02035, partial [Chryseobacterium sp.]